MMGRELRPCGTAAAASRHRRNGEELCEACRAVERERHRAKQARFNARPATDPVALRFIAGEIESRRTVRDVKVGRRPDTSGFGRIESTTGPWSRADRDWIFACPRCDGVLERTVRKTDDDWAWWVCGRCKRRWVHNPNERLPRSGAPYPNRDVGSERDDATS